MKKLSVFFASILFCLSLNAQVTSIMMTHCLRDSTLGFNTYKAFFEVYIGFDAPDSILYTNTNFTQPYGQLYNLQSNTIYYVDISAFASGNYFFFAVFKSGQAPIALTYQYTCPFAVGVDDPEKVENNISTKSRKIYVENPEAKVYSILGKEVETNVINEITSTNELPSGIYIVVQDNSTKKVVISDY